MKTDNTQHTPGSLEYRIYVELSLRKGRSLTAKTIGKTVGCSMNEAYDILMLLRKNNWVDFKQYNQRKHWYVPKPKENKTNK